MCRGRVAPGKRTVFSGKRGISMTVSGGSNALAEEPAGAPLVGRLDEEAQAAGRRRHAERRHRVAALDVNADTVALEDVAPDACFELVAGRGQGNKGVA